MEIPPYFLVNDSFAWYYYLTIHGGTGKKDGAGGQYAFYITYLRPDQYEGINKALDYWCQDRQIPCGVGDTLEQAYNDFIKKRAILPLK